MASSPIFPPLPPSSSSPKGEDKHVSLEGRYASVWLTRVVRIGMIFCLVHLIIVAILTPFMMGGTKGDGSSQKQTLENVASSPVTGSGRISLWPLVVGCFSIIQILLSGIINHWTLWIILTCVIQIFTTAIFARVYRKYPENRGERIVLYFGGQSLGSLVCIIGMGLSSAFMCHSYMNILGFANFKQESNKTGDLLEQECPDLMGPSLMCWNLQYRGIISIIALCNMCMFYSQYIGLNFVLTYPTIDVSYAERVRLSFSTAWGDCFKSIFYICIFISIGFVIKTFIFMASPTYLGNVMEYGIAFNLKFYCHSIIWLAFSLYSLKLCWRLVEVCLTELLYLPVETKFASTTTIVTLSDGMKFGPPPMQYLGFYEFNIMACMPKSAERVAQFFCLSHPGRHPRNWSGVLDATLSQCQDLTTTLKAFIQKSKIGSMPNRPGNPSTFSSATLVNSSETSQSGANNGVRKRGFVHTEIRDLAAPLQDAQPINDNRFPRYFVCTPQILKIAVQRIFQHLWDISIVPRISKIKNYMADNDPHCELANKMSSGQLIIWGTNAIVEISILSFVYDNHGIVQRDMRKIVSVLLELHDTLTIVGELTTRTTYHTPLTKNAKIAHSLIKQLFSSLTFGLTRLHGEFSTYYKILGVSETDERKLYELTSRLTK